MKSDGNAFSFGNKTHTTNDNTISIDLDKTDGTLGENTGTAKVKITVKIE